MINQRLWTEILTRSDMNGKNYYELRKNGKFHNTYLDRNKAKEEENKIKNGGI